MSGPARHPDPHRPTEEADMKAAVFHGPHQPLTIEEVDIDKPIGREVLVRVVASGVCHSDLHFVDGYYPFPTPAILGHEAAGIVEEVGLQVSEVKAQPHVIACLSVFCGHCDYCLTGKTHLCQTRPVRAKTDPPKLSWKGQPVNQFANLSAYAVMNTARGHALSEGHFQGARIEPPPSGRQAWDYSPILIQLCEVLEDLQG